MPITAADCLRLVEQRLRAAERTLETVQRSPHREALGGQHREVAVLREVVDMLRQFEQGESPELLRAAAAILKGDED